MDSERRSSPRQVFVAFAGGGAKGLIHVGALRALEQRGVEFLGLAGTSAGALIATLRAAGMSGNDLFDTQADRNLLERLRAIDCSLRRMTDLFGEGDWWKIVAFRKAVGAPLISGAVAGAAIIILVVALWLTLAPLFWPLAALAIFVLLFWVKLTSLAIIQGLADARRLKSLLTALLQQLMFPSELGRVPKMGDFGRDGRPTLKIVSANLSRGRLHLFSPNRTPEVPVADAVVASICLPIIFDPQFVDGELHVDGGIVSNLPAWSFDEERELNPDAITIAFEIAQPIDKTVLTKVNWLPSFIRTGLFGSGELNLRASGHAERIVLASSLELLDFDLDRAAARQEVIDAETAAGLALDDRLFRKPDVYMDACEVTRGIVDDVLSAVLPLSSGRTRVAIAYPDRSYSHSLRLQYSAGYGDDPDEGMLLPILGSVAGHAWSTGESLLEIGHLPDIYLAGDANRFRRSMIRKDLEWVFAIPIYIEGKVSPLLVVQIDGDETLPMTADVESAISQIEQDVRDFFASIGPNLADKETDNGMD